MPDRESTHLHRCGRKSGEPSASGLLGIGLDGRDGHERITHGDDFLLVGGSEETHERMQALVVRMEEKLKREGRRIRDLEGKEFEDRVRESLE